MTPASKPASGVAHETTADAVVATVSRFRARAVAIMFVRQLVMAATLVAVVAAGFEVTSPTIIFGDPTTLAFAALTALVMAGATTYIRRPSLVFTGAAIDRSLQFQDHVVAALALADDGSPVAALVRRDALDRLRKARTADVFPVELDRRVTASAVVFSVALAAILTDVTPQRLDSPRASNEASPFDASTTGDAPAGPNFGDPSESAGVRAVASSNTAAVPREPTDPSPREDTITTKTADSSSSGAMETPPGTMWPANDSSRGAGSRADSAGAVRPATIGGVAIADAPGAALSGRPSLRGTAAGVPTSAGGSQVTSEESGTQAGGVSGGPLATNAAGPRRFGASRSRDASTAVTRAQADAVLTRDDIPPARRRYVREYFLRLQSGGGKR
jgi:hypothetical protein